jgi:hypothetical protein
VDWLIGSMIRKGIWRGLLEGNPWWVAIFVVSVLVWLARRSSNEVLYRGTLGVGESLTVSHHQPSKGL